VAVLWDSEGPASGNADRVWRTARGGWLLHDPDADWHLLLQDDAWPCADLLAGLENALERVPPDAVVSAYLGRGGATPARWGRMAAQADRTGASFVVSWKLMWGVAIILPTKRIGEMIERADRMAGVTDDMRVAGWADRTRTDVWYTWPSLVDHRPVPSLTKHHAKNRRAERHHPGSALELAWTGPVVEVSVETQPGVDVRADLARAVVGGGFDLLEMQRMGMSLEDIFLQVTTTDAAHDAAAPAGGEGL